MYFFIQRAAQHAERLHSKLQQWCDKQQQKITVFTEQRDQLRTAQEQLEGQLRNITQVFSKLWLHVTDHYPQFPPDVMKTSLVAQAFHLWIAYNSLHREHQELQAALAAWPVLPNPKIVYSAQVAAKQGQAAQMQATLNSTVHEAYDLLKSL